MSHTLALDKPRIYRSRRSEKTILYRTVQSELESWLEERSFNNELPFFVEKEFRSFLRCGILAYGFARAHCAGCGHDFLIAFSCKGRGFCPSCNTRRMVETAAHLTDHVFPKVPVRQWVLSLPKRFRYYLQQNPKYVGPVLRILVSSIEKVLIVNVPCELSRCRLGAVSFLQRFGSVLNLHFHFHSCVMDGVFDREGNFYPVDYLTKEEIKGVEEDVRRRVTRFFIRKGILEEEKAARMLGWEHGGFSLDASVRIEAQDRAGLERLLRYCARPIFASCRLEKEGERLKYVLSKAGRTKELYLKPFELLDRLALLIPPPRRHRHMYHGVLAPNSPLRPIVVSCAGKEIVNNDQKARLFWESILPEVPEEETVMHTAPVSEGFISLEEIRPCKIGWAKLLARIYEVEPLVCPKCGFSMRIVSFIEDREVIHRILYCINEPIDPPQIASARGPPEPEFEYNQRWLE